MVRKQARGSNLQRTEDRMVDLNKGNESNEGNKYVSGWLGFIKGDPMKPMALGGLGKKGKGKQANEAPMQVFSSPKQMVGHHGEIA